MPSRRINIGIFTISALLLCGLFVADLALGAVRFSLSDLWQTLFDSNPSLNKQILFDLRLPKALTAIMAGSALAVSGLMMQTLFRNPLAGPYILGVSSGATLGVGILVMMGSLIGFVATNVFTILAAVIGATFCLLVVLAVSSKVQNNVSLLIIGMMIGSIAGALVNLMQNFANPDSLKLFVMWSLGSLSSVTWLEMPFVAAIFILGMVVAVLLIKPLNGLLLGENYAQGLGINIRQVRLWIVLATGLLAGGITAFCGPIAFVGVAIPHIARGLCRSSNHRIILPLSALLGAVLLLLCDIISNQFTYPVPISTLSAIFGAPVIIAIILRKQT